MPKMVFVVMPFTSTPTRNKGELSAFFQENLKEAVERRPIDGERFIVRRSDDTFNINEQVIRDLYTADIVIADLSGREANPNVMYELGLRLAVSNKPVILIREAHDENRTIFDIAGFHTFVYSPAQYEQLEAYIVTKIERFASKAEDYRSPVLSVLEQEPSIVRRIEADRLYNRLTAASHSIYDLRRSVIPRIVEFCRGKVDVIFSEMVDEFQEQFAANYNQLERLDWSSARIRVRPNPSLLNLVAEPPDAKLIGDEHYKALSAYLNQFFMSLFAFDDDWQIRQVGLLIGEGPLLEDLVDATRRMLSEDERVVAHGKSEFRKLLGKSNFSWHVAIQHFLSLPDETADRRQLVIPGGTGVFETDEKLLEVIRSAPMGDATSGPELLAVLEQALRGSGASGASLEKLLDNFAWQLKVSRERQAKSNPLQGGRFISNV